MFSALTYPRVFDDNQYPARSDGTKASHVHLKAAHPI